MCSSRILATRGGKRTKGAAGPIRALWFKSLSEPVHRLHIASKLSSKSICNLTGAANPGSSLIVTLLAVKAGLRTLAWFFAASAFFTLGPMQGTAEARSVSRTFGPHHTTPFLIVCNGAGTDIFPCWMWLLETCPYIWPCIDLSLEMPESCARHPRCRLSRYTYQTF